MVDRFFETFYIFTENLKPQEIEREITTPANRKYIARHQRC